MSRFFVTPRPNVYTFLYNLFTRIEKISLVCENSTPLKSDIKEEKLPPDSHTRYEYLRNLSKTADDSLYHGNIYLMDSYHKAKDDRKRFNIRHGLVYTYTSKTGRTVKLFCDKTDLNGHPIRLLRLGVICLAQEDASTWQKFKDLLQKLQAYPGSFHELLKDEDIALLERLENSPLLIPATDYTFSA